jgi:L-iditol 2-dehydrogenase
MRVATLIQDHRLSINELPDPVPAAGEVLIRVSFAGVCGSDLHAYKGLHPFRKPPVVLGHELAGLVAKVGPGVKRVKPGDLVTVMPSAGCGACPACQGGETNLCLKRRAPGSGDWIGTFAELFRAPAEVVYKVPAGVSAAAAVLAEPLATTCHAARVSGMKAGERVLIIGAGTIGLLAALTFKSMGTARIAVTDVEDFNLGLAGRYTGALAYNAREASLEERILKDTPEKFDLTLLCANAEPTVRQALALTRKGGRIVVLGMFLKPVPLDLLAVTTGELAVLGSWIYTGRDFQAALDLIASKRYDFDGLITHRRPLEKAGEALAILEEHRDNVVKVLIEMAG